MIRTLWVGVWLACAAWAQEPVAASLEGQVVNSVTGEAIAGATVVVTPVAQRRAATETAAVPAGPAPVRTGADGGFRFAPLSAMTYQVMASRQGYAGEGAAVQAVETLRLGEGEQRKGLKLSLTPTATISGKVLDENGEPVMGAQVMVLRQYRWRGAQQRQWTNAWAETEESGGYRIGGLAPGEYLVMARYVDLNSVAPPGLMPNLMYVATYYPGTAEISEAVALKLEPGREQSGLDVRLKRQVTFKISGRVVGGGAGTPQVSVVVVPLGETSGMGFAGEVKLEGDHFEAQRLTPGRYAVWAQWLGTAPMRSAYVEVEVGTEDVAGLVVQPGPPGELRGRLVLNEAPGQRVDWRRCQVTLQPEMGRGYGSAGSGKPAEDGGFTISFQKAGRAELRATCAVNRVYLASIRVGGQEKLGHAIEPATAGEVTVEFRGDPGIVRGTVDGGKVADGVGVWLIPEDQALWDPALMFFGTVQKGAFTIDGVRPGAYTVGLAEEGGRMRGLGDVAYEAMREKGQKVEVKAGETASVVVKK